MDRRRLLRSGSLLVLSLAGAGSLQPGKALSQAATPALDETNFAVLAETDDGRLVRHVAGETVVPLRPERIVTLSSTETDTVLALGATPIGVGTFTGQDFSSYGYLEAFLTEAAIVGKFTEPDLEAVVTINPDLIIGRELHHELFDLLSQIAPTVLLPEHADSVQYAYQVGTLLGRDEDTAARIAEHEALVAAAKQEIAAAIGQGPVAFVRIYPPNEVRLYGNGNVAGRVLYERLELRPPALVSELAWNEGLVRISLEQLPLLDADHIFLLDQTLDPTTAQTDDLLVLDDTPIWTNFPAMQAGQVYPISRDIWINTGLLADEAITGDVLAALVPEE